MVSMGKSDLVEVFAENLAWSLFFFEGTRLVRFESGLSASSRPSRDNPGNTV
jgi:hypothetical protein